MPSFKEETSSKIAQSSEQQQDNSHTIKQLMDKIKELEQQVK